MCYTMRSMDATDIRIVELLGEDGQLSNREVARRIGLSEGAVRQRLTRMMASGKVRICAQVNVEEMADQYMAIVAIKLDGRHLTECAEQVDKLQGVQSTMIVTGQYDLIVTLLLDSRQGLVDFVTKQLSLVPGVRESETFVVLKTMNHWIRADALTNTPGSRAE